MYLLLFWWNASKQISKGIKGREGRGKGGGKVFMCQLCASMESQEKRCQACILFISANRHTSNAVRRWVIMALGIHSTVDQGAIHATVNFTLTSDNNHYLYYQCKFPSFFHLTIIGSTSHFPFFFLAQSVWIFYASLPFFGVSNV